MRAIIPCCGFGTRVNMLPNESKEMLPDPDMFDSPSRVHIIDYSISFCKQHYLLPHIISRPEKVGLNEYIKYHTEGVSLQMHTPVGEWPLTVLASKDFWEEDNLLILPDTRFSYPHQAIQQMKHSLDMGCQAVIFTHEVKDPDKWGIIKDYTIHEKPTKFTSPQTAWGLIAFKKDYGEILFDSMARKEPFSLTDTAFIKLSHFEDITRKK